MKNKSIELLILIIIAITPPLISFIGKSFFQHFGSPDEMVAKRLEKELISISDHDNIYLGNNCFAFRYPDSWTAHENLSNSIAGRIRIIRKDIDDETVFIDVFLDTINIDYRSSENVAYKDWVKQTLYYHKTIYKPETITPIKVCKLKMGNGYYYEGVMMDKNWKQRNYFIKVPGINSVELRIYVSVIEGSQDSDNLWDDVETIVNSMIFFEPGIQSKRQDNLS